MLTFHAKPGRKNVLGYWGYQQGEEDPDYHGIHFFWCDIITVLLGLVGVIAGIAVSIPITWYFTLHPISFTGQAAETMLQMGFEPIMSFSMTPSVFYNQAVTILIFTMIIGLYPVFNIYRLKINNALHS